MIPSCSTGREGDKGEHERKHMAAGPSGSAAPSHWHGLLGRLNGMGCVS